jgi:hypothetical protein
VVIFVVLQLVFDGVSVRSNIRGNVVVVVGEEANAETTTPSDASYAVSLVAA